MCLTAMTGNCDSLIALFPCLHRFISRMPAKTLIIFSDRDRAGSSLRSFETKKFGHPFGHKDNRIK